MAEREDRHKHRHRRHRKSKDQKKKKSDEEIPHVRLSSKVDEFSICGENGDGTSDGETTITLTKSDERYRQFMRESDEERNEKLAIEKGWCTNDGIPWGRNQMPKDEVALLKQGVVNRSGTRSTYHSISAKAPAFTDFEQQNSETRVSFSPSRQYNFSESSKKKKKSKKSRKSKETSSSPSPSAQNDGTFGTIYGVAGDGKDGGTIAYTITNDGRNYQLNTYDGHHLHLEFNKKHAYLIVD